MSTPTVRFPWFLLIGLLATACIADTKLPPEPTVEYLPCSTMELAGPRTERPPALMTSTLFGGSWTEGEEFHIGITDPGEIDWSEMCEKIGDPLVVIHEVPHSMIELLEWSHQVEAQIDEASAVGLTIINGQYVVNVLTPELADAAGVTQGIPLTAWVYGGPRGKPIGGEPVD